MFFFSCLGPSTAFLSHRGSLMSSVTQNLLKVAFKSNKWPPCSFCIIFIFPHYTKPYSLHLISCQYSEYISETIIHSPWNLECTLSILVTRKYGDNFELSLVLPKLLAQVMAIKLFPSKQQIFLHSPVYQEYAGLPSPTVKLLITTTIFHRLCIHHLDHNTDPRFSLKYNG